MKTLWNKFRRWEPIYWFRARVWHRYHLVDVRGEDGYKWGYMDPCSKMYLACFKVLKEFILETGWKEHPPKIEDYYTLGPTGRPTETCKDSSCYGEERDWWDGEKEQIEGQITWQNEVWEIFCWWEFDRKKEWDRVDALLNGIDLGFDTEPFGDGEFVRVKSRFRDNPKWKEWCEGKDRLEKKDDEMLEKLIKYRRYLWT